MASYYAKRGFYYIDFWVGGKRKSLNTQLKATARNLKKVEKMKEDIEKEVEIKKKEIKQRNYEQYISEEEQIDKVLTINELIEKYKIKLSVRSKSHQEVFKYATVGLLKIISGDLTPKEVTREHIIRYVNLQMQTVRDTTLETYVNYLSAFFNYLVDEGYILKSPIRKKDLPKKSRKVIVTFPKEMLDKILEESLRRDVTLYYILKLLGFIGLRPIDLLTMKVGDLDLTENLIIIRMSKVNKEMYFPIYDDLKKFLTEELLHIISKNPEEYLFPGYSVSRVGRKFRRIKVKLGITDKFMFTLKTFRKTFATHYAQELPIQDIANLLGHDDVTMANKFYAKIFAEELRKKMNKKNVSV